MIIFNMRIKNVIELIKNWKLIKPLPRLDDGYAIVHIKYKHNLSCVIELWRSGGSLWGDLNFDKKYKPWFWATKEEVYNFIEKNKHNNINHYDYLVVNKEELLKLFKDAADRDRAFWENLNKSKMEL